MGNRGNRGNPDGVEQLQPSGSPSDLLIDFDDLDLYTEDGLSEDNSEQQQQNSSSITYASSDNGRGGYQGNRGNRGNQGGLQQHRSSSFGDLLAEFDNVDPFSNMGQSEGFGGEMRGSGVRGGYQGNRGNRGNRGNQGGLQQLLRSSSLERLVNLDTLALLSSMGHSEGFGGEMRGSGVRDGYQGNRGNYQRRQDANNDDPSKRQRQWPGRDKTEICMHFIIGHCKHEDKCYRHHDKMPYRWQVKEGIEWTALAKNEAIENDFCDPQKTHSGTTDPVDFDIMSCGPRKVRRLSTSNSLAQPAYLHTTEWVWYWEDEFAKWNVYASSPAADMESSELEKRFLANPSDVVDFIVGSQSYSLSFQDMIQTNNHFSTKRLVRRRPRFVSAADVKAKRMRRPLGQPSFLAIPDHWDKTQIPATGYKRVSLQRTSQEFMKIQAMFFTTMRGYDIVTIERIQNKPLWESFQLQKTQMRTNNGGRDVQEKNLFHGTDSVHVDAICLTNFDWRICGTHGTAFGTGSYFARDAKYSHSYTDDSDVKSLFISRVLVGDFTKGSSDYRRPPSKDGRAANLYDSCVDDVTNPSIYVVFERQQIYPEYLLQYKTSGFKTVHHQPATNPYVTTAPSLVRSTPAQSYTASNQPSNTVRRPAATNPFVTTAPALVRSTSAQPSTASNQPSNLSYNSNSATFQYTRSPSSSSLPKKKTSDSCAIA